MYKTIIIFLILLISNELYSQKIDPNFWITNGSVNTIVDDEDYIYVGGSFTEIGNNFGRGILISTDSVYIYPESKSRINGIIGVINEYTIDKYGNRYCSMNSYDSLGNSENIIVKIKNDGTIDKDFKLKLKNDIAHMIIDSNYLYVSIGFEDYNQFNFDKVYRYDLYENRLDTSWNKFKSKDYYIVGKDSTYFYIVEKINLPKYENYYKLMKYNILNENFEDTLIEEYRGYISKLHFEKEGIFINGTFYIKGIENKNLIKIDKNTGQLDSNLNNIKIFDSNFYQSINDIFIDKDHIYIVGTFNKTITKNYNNIIRIDRNDYSVDTKFKNFNFGTGGIYDIEIIDDYIFIAGDFINFDGKNINYLAKFNKNNGEIDTNWNYKINDNIYYLSSYNSTLYIGGKFASCYTHSKNSLFRIKKNTFDIDISWNPIINSSHHPSISKLCLDDRYIYLSGNFTKINGQTVNYIARLTIDSAKYDYSWNARSNGLIFDFAIDEDNIYVLGDFALIGGRKIYNLAKLNKTNGNCDKDWVPLKQSQNVNSIAIDDQYVYLGGQFNNIENKINNNIVRIAKNSGEILNDTIFNIDYLESRFSKVNKILTKENKIFLLGKFYISKDNYNYLTILENGKVLENIFKTNYYIESNALHVDGEDLYIGLTSRKEDNRFFINPDITVGEISNKWNMYFSGNPKGIITIYKNDDFILLGGYFDNINGIAYDNLVKIDIIKPRYSITGRVLKNKEGVENIEVSNGFSSVFTNSEGVYKFDSLLTAKYTINPLSKHYIYYPENYSITLDSNLVNLDFELFNKDNAFKIKDNVLFSDNIEGLKYSIINLRGQIVKKDNLNFEVDFNYLSNGIYILYVLKDEKIIWSDKLIILR